ncbi:hypothetical protein PA598K_06248 [Paenibacillus sp. 598K]|uniref:PhzF family phenazine biosynthesis protein n=1 Tax=Paenibacillus sp. 598K TaxID=1117987 RepID=UPI000FFA6483|nr:PhzF family phenazine biosynthesis protein [Paenibacillus sp. 598K]GBF77686.1 hypothetical protein PA598K_06248 [Paenibacillus sp. 598K]
MRYYIVDVFAEQRYQGNQLAVFAPLAPLPEETMQQIAKEINYHETTFIVSPKQPDGGYDVRIFTPDTEVPFAGHPTLGTAYIIHHMLEQDGETTVRLNLEAGQIPVTIDGERLTMRQNPPVFGEPLDDREQLCRILQIEPDDMEPDYPIQVVSTGLPSYIVPLRSLDALNRCRIAPEAYQRLIDTADKANILAFSRETIRPDNDIHVRVFVDDPGFAEDPATGSANGNLAGYLVAHRYFGEQRLSYRAEQGYRTGRPSLLHVEAEQQEEAVDIFVGGQVFLQARGEWL